MSNSFDFSESSDTCIAFFQVKDHSPITLGHPVNIRTIDGQSLSYEVHAMMQHYGHELSSGHYFGHIKHIDKFYKVSDTDVIKESTEAELASSQIFFYKKK